MNPRSDLSTEMIQHDIRHLSQPAPETIRAADDSTAQADAEIIIRNAETVQRALQSGAEIAVRMTECSAANINAIVKSNVDLVEVSRTMSRDWIVLRRRASRMVLTGSDVCGNTARLSILSISKKKSCVAVLTPFLDTRSASATSPCVWQTS
jgi:hypothetical protein